MFTTFSIYNPIVFWQIPKLICPREYRCVVVLVAQSIRFDDEFAYMISRETSNVNKLNYISTERVLTSSTKKYLCHTFTQMALLLLLSLNCRVYAGSSSNVLTNRSAFNAVLQAARKLRNGISIVRRISIFDLHWHCVRN